MARVFAQAAPLLFLDEPTAALDVRFQELVLRGVAERVCGRATAVVVIHDLVLAAAHATRVVLLAGGEVAADGPPSEVLTGSLLSEVYEHPITVMPHPHSGAPLVLPSRSPNEGRTDLA